MVFFVVVEVVAVVLLAGGTINTIKYMAFDGLGVVAQEWPRCRRSLQTTWKPTRTACDEDRLEQIGSRLPKREVDFGSWLHELLGGWGTLSNMLGAAFLFCVSPYVSFIGTATWHIHREAATWPKYVRYLCRFGWFYIEISAISQVTSAV